MALLLLGRGRLDSGDAPLARVLKRAYASVLGPLIRRPTPAFAAVGVLAVVGVFAVPHLGQSLLPDFKERDFLMHWLTKPGTSLPEETRISQAACADLVAISGVRNCGSHIGQAAFSDAVTQVKSG